MTASVSVRPQARSKVNYKILNELCCSDLLYEPLKLRRKTKSKVYTVEERSVKERGKRCVKLCFFYLFLMKNKHLHSVLTMNDRKIQTEFLLLISNDRELST